MSIESRRHRNVKNNRQGRRSILGWKAEQDICVVPAGIVLNAA